MRITQEQCHYNLRVYLSTQHCRNSQCGFSALVIKPKLVPVREIIRRVETFHRCINFTFLMQTGERCNANFVF